jgi:hypothetical protein
MARREERAYREYVSDEQRSQAGCIGGQSGTRIRGRVLSRSPPRTTAPSIESAREPPGGERTVGTANGGAGLHMPSRGVLH